jgi:hypothetical protein
MDFVKLEDLACKVRSLAGYTDGDAPLSVDIAVSVLGRPRVALCDGDAGGRYSHGRITVGRRCPDINFGVAFGLAQWALLTQTAFAGRRSEWDEAGRLLGAALLAPPRQVRAAYDRFGEDLLGLSTFFRVSQTCIALRLGEVFGWSSAVVTQSGRVLARDPKWLELPALAIARGLTAIPGIRRTQFERGLPLDDGRIALRYIA